MAYFEDDGVFYKRCGRSFQSPTTSARSSRTSSPKPPPSRKRAASTSTAGRALSTALHGDRLYDPAQAPRLELAGRGGRADRGEERANHQLGPQESGGSLSARRDKSYHGPR